MQHTEHQRLSNKIQTWILRNSVVTFCVATSLQNLWCCNAFYIYDPNTVSFYFLSQLRTRHATMASSNTTVAGTINTQTRNIKSLRGIQFSGVLTMLSGTESRQRFADYSKHFYDISSDLLSAPIWKIHIQELKFTDNTTRFGEKTCWSRCTDNK